MKISCRLILTWPCKFWRVIYLILISSDFYFQTRRAIRAVTVSFHCFQSKPQSRCDKTLPILGAVSLSFPTRQHAMRAHMRHILQNRFPEFHEISSAHEHGSARKNRRFVLCRRGRACRRHN